MSRSKNQSRCTEIKISLDWPNSKEKRENYGHGNLSIVSLSDTPPQNERVFPGSPITDTEKSYAEFAKNIITGSLDSIRNFAQLMVPLTTGLITAYLALLKFLGLETYVKQKEP